MAKKKAAPKATTPITLTPEQIAGLARFAIDRDNYGDSGMTQTALKAFVGNMPADQTVASFNLTAADLAVVKYQVKSACDDLSAKGKAAILAAFPK